jgi:hypothetical protein
MSNIPKNINNVIAINITTSNLVTSNFSSTNATFNSIALTNTTIPNLVSTNLSSGSLNVINISASTLNAVSGLTTGNINFTGSLFQNGQLYVGSQWTSTSGNVSYTSGNVIIGGLASVSNLISTTATVPNVVSTNISTSTLNAVSGLTTGNINFTGSLFQNGVPYVGSQWTSTSGNVSYTSGNIIVGGLISTSNLISTTSTLANLTTTNITAVNVVSTNSSIATINVSTGITSAALLITGLASISNLSATTATIPNTVSTNISTGTINTTGITSTNVLISGLASVANLSATTSTIPNIIHTNISTGTINASTGITSNSLVVTSLASMANLFSTTATIPSLTTTNITTGSINASSGITGGVLRVTGDAVIVGNLSAGNLFINLFTAGNVITNNVNYGVSNTYSGSFAAANNVGTATAITNLQFNSSATGSFTINLNVNIVTSPSIGNLMSYNILEGYYTNSGWTLLTNTSGDASGIVFTINSSTGQINYTSTNVTNWVSSTFRYHVTSITINGTYNSLLNPTQASYSLSSIQLNNTSIAVAGSNTGALYTLGGITVGQNLQVYSTTDATAVGSGGSLTVLGGAAISKNLVVGTGLSVANLNASNISSGTLTLTNLIDGPVLYARSFSTSSNLQIYGGHSSGFSYLQLGSSSTNGNLRISKYGTNTTQIDNMEVYSTNILLSGTVTASNLFATTSTIPNIIHTNISTGTINVSSNLTAINNSNTLGNIFTTGGNVGIGTTSPVVKLDLTQNNDQILALYSINANNSFYGFGAATSALKYQSAGAHRFYTGSSAGAVGTEIANITTTGFSSSNVYAISGTITNLVGTNISSSTLSATTSTIPNIVGTNISTGTINASAGITSATLLVTGLASVANLSATASTVVNLINTNISTGTINASTGITSANLFSPNTTITNLILTSGSIGSLSTGNISVSGNMTVGGNLLVQGSLISVNITSVNVIDTNITAGTLNATLASIPNLITTNISSGTLRASTNIAIGSNTAAYTLDVTGSARFTTGVEISGGNLSVTRIGVTNYAATYYQNNNGNLYVGIDGFGLTNDRVQAALYTSVAPISFYTGATFRMIIGSTGNIGINNATPAYTLDVAGTLNVSTVATIPSLTTTTITTSSLMTNSTIFSKAGISINTTTVNSSSVASLYISSRMNSTGNMLNANTAGSTLTNIDVKVMNKRQRTSRANATRAVSTFTLRTMAASGFWQDIAWSAELGLFATVSNAGGTTQVQTSPDGITWTARTTSGSAGYWCGICWAAELGLFVIVSNNGNIASINLIMTSPDGITWSQQTAPSSQNLYGICWSPELSILVASGNTNTLLTSSNGTSWSSTTNTGHTILKMCWAAELSLFVGVEYSNASYGFAYSSNGTTWTGVASRTNELWWGICWSPELYLFVAVSATSSANPIATSPDGINWTSRSTPFTTSMFNVIWSPELSLFVASGSTYIFTSSDGINWITRYSSFTSASYTCWSPELSMLCFVLNGSSNALTTNPVLSNSKSAVLANPSYMYVNNTSGNVGIGTTSPVYTLDVSGVTRFSSPLNNAFVFNCSTSNNNPCLVISNSISQVGYIGIGGSAVVANYSNNMFLQSPNSMNFLTGSGLYTLFLGTSGNVGIGTTSPNSILHLRSAVYPTSGNVLIEPGTSSDGLNPGYTAININGYYNAGDQRLNTGKQRWRFVADQRTTSDTFSLDTYNGTTVTSVFSASTAGNIGFGGNVDISGSQMSLNNGTSNTIIFNGVGLAAPTVANNVGSGCKINLYPTYGIGIEASGIWYHSNGGLHKWYSGGTPFNYMTLNGANLGIGTASPRASLEITQSSSTTGAMLYSGLNEAGINRLIFNHSSDSANYQKVQIQTQSLGTGQFGKSNFAICLNTVSDTSNATFADHKFFISGSSGNVGIGTTAPTGILQVSNAMLMISTGNLTVTGDVLAFGTISDQRLKTNVQDVSGALDTIKALRPVTFDWKTDIFNKQKAGTSDSGFIAQEVADIIPHAIGEYKDIESGDTFMNLRHERFNPYIVGAIQELVAKVNSLEAEIEILKSK